MADLSVTAANVEKVSGQAVNAIAGGTITAGQSLYADSTDGGQIKAAINTTAAPAACVGIALHAALDEQPIAYLKAGVIDIGATMTIGDVILVSSTAGGLFAHDDSGFGAGDFVTVVGIAITANNIALNIQVGGVALAA